MKTRKSQVWICHRTKFWNQCHFNATGFNSQDFIGVLPTLHESFCWWNREYFWLWFWWALTSVPSTISLELDYGQNWASAKFSSHKLGIMQRQNEKGPQSSHCGSPPSVFLSSIYLKQYLKNISEVFTASSDHLPLFVTIPVTRMFSPISNLILSSLIKSIILVLLTWINSFFFAKYTSYRKLNFCILFGLLFTVNTT